MPKGQMRYQLSLAIAIAVFLLGCGTPVTRQTPIDSAAASSRALTPKQGQVLPISATIILGGETIELEVTQTPQQQALGLMFRDPLPDNRGMLFTFEPAREVGFWMKNVSVPLDMIFLRDGVIRAIANAPPCTSDPCPTYGPREPIDQVIELRGGRAAELGLKQGDRAIVTFLE